MADEEHTGAEAPTTSTRTRKRATKSPPDTGDTPVKAPAKRARGQIGALPESVAPAEPKRPRKATAATPDKPAETSGDAAPAKPARKRATKSTTTTGDTKTGIPPGIPGVTFQPPEAGQEPAKPARARAPRININEPAKSAPADTPRAAGASATDRAEGPAGEQRDDIDGEGADPRKRRRRGRRGRGGKGRTGTGEGAGSTAGSEDGADEPRGSAAAENGDREPSSGDGADEGGEGGTGTARRRRRRKRGPGEDVLETVEDGVPTVVKVRPASRSEGPDAQGVQGIRGSTRLEAKKQRRKDGRDSSRRRRPIVTEAEFLARREAVERVMLVRQSEDRTQIAVLEDDVLVEHYVTKASATSYAGNVYLGRVQNVLPSMEAAFVDIGKGRNAVLYAGEVNYDASALEGRPPRIEQALKSGQAIVVQVTKDPIGSKGARLTSQVSLPGRYMVYVPEQSMTGISRKLPDTERSRLKAILKEIKPEGAGIIVRTAAEGASQEDLTADLERLKAQWEVISAKAKKVTPPELLYGEPDLVIRVVRDNFNEDFTSLVVEGDEDFEMIEGYLSTLAPDLLPKLSRYTDATPMFEAYRVDEQIAKALDRKVSLPSGGSLVIDRTEAMTVVDVNTGKFTGKGGNLEETVTKNNLEAAEEVVRQLRLRDVGGIIVIDFIDMILENNRDLVLRRLTECLGRDRTKHQVSEVTSLGLVQMTRKRISQGLYEAFTETCPECNGRGVLVTLPAAPTKASRKASAGPKPGPPRVRPQPPVEAEEVAEVVAEVEVEAQADIDLVEPLVAAD